MAVRIRKYTTLSALALMLLTGACCWAADASKPVNDGDVVLVKNSLAKVTKADFYTELNRLPEEYRGGVESSGENIIKKLDGILLNKSLAEKARQLKIDSEPEVKQLFQWMIEKGLAQMLTDRVVLDAAAQFKAKEAEFEPRAKEIYKVSPEKFREKATASASHVLVGLEKRSKQEALARALEVRKLALEGKSFDELAVQYSDDPSARKNNGNLGTFGPGQMVKPFEDAVFALAKPGDISEPVETPFGFHIIRLQDKRAAHLKTYAEARAGIMDELKAEYIKHIQTDYIAKINSDKATVVNQEAIATLKKPINPVQDPAKSGAKP